MMGRRSFALSKPECDFPLNIFHSFSASQTGPCCLSGEDLWVAPFLLSSHRRGWKGPSRRCPYLPAEWCGICPSHRIRQVVDEWQWQRIQQHGGVFRAVAQAGLISSCSSIQNYGSGGVSVASWCLVPLGVLLVSPCRIDVRVMKYLTLPLRYTTGGVLYGKYCIT